MTSPTTSPAQMSLLNRAYYLFKPFLPLSTRYALRRIRARRILGSNPDWPIAPSSAKPPAGWKGWPNGKQFAVVLTHDVEGPIGVKRTIPLAQLEAKLGFRASFNFIPEGDYRVTKELRHDLIADGFEVGVHDLRHDGSLFRTKQSFLAAAKQINRYLKEWNAVGFRAGFMFHNLEWIKALNVLYDASTFDVDPFEAQSDGTNTIFPFWVPDGADSGYIELPYTLTQDSTLFLILEERSTRIWKKKLEWLVENGGMVLINTHPDYVAFKNGKPRISEFPSELYADFLQHIRDAYPNAYWNALPRDVARHAKSMLAPGAS